MSLTVIKPGLLCSVQDRGRSGHAALGLGRAGALDLPAWQLANALVGNRDDEAALEFSLLGPTLHFAQDAWIALTGAVDQIQLDEVTLPGWSCLFVPAGTTLKIGPVSQGCRGYLAVRGGLALAPQLGSRSSDLHAGIGPLPRCLQAGDELPIGPATPLNALPAGSAPRALHWGVDPAPWRDPSTRPLALLPGSHQSLLDDDAMRALWQSRWRIGQDSNRTASRLLGPRLSLRAPLELISEACLPGTLQLPPSGQPIALLAEAPVTGGYPRIGQLAQVDLPRLAQQRPGDTVSFEPSTLEQAWHRLQRRQQALTRLSHNIARRLQP
ncbi:MAG: biotin-dependent carboxyltransferase family protein [Dyella sp.]